ncbi:MAG TPA: hypothetical protein VFU22_15810 [Roseiflexaceae bacterium]|nr:hypothetical protein [Roseiflexaceae bacterium]
MVTKQIASAGRNHRAGGLGWWIAGWIGLTCGILLIVAILVASRTDLPLAAAVKQQQPVVGSALTVMGLVYDGTRYMNVPIQIVAPNAGRGYTVTALVYDGTAYRAVPVRVSRH